MAEGKDFLMPVMVQDIGLIGPRSIEYKLPKSLEPDSTEVTIDLFPFL